MKRPDYRRVLSGSVPTWQFSQSYKWEALMGRRMLTSIACWGHSQAAFLHPSGG